MAVEIATAYVTILPSARGFGRNLARQVDGEMSAGNVGAKAGSNIAMNFGKALTIGVLGATTAATAGLVALGKAGATQGLKIAASNEQASVSFETMLGSADAALKMINELKKFAAETPFEFPELQQAATSLLTTGVEADKIIPIMRTLGDVTSGMGTGAEGVQRATIALQQMNAAGRILAEDLNQLRDAGIPVFDLLAGATGKTKEELSQMAQSGKLGRQELDLLMKALESGKGLEKFTGLMEKQSKTLNGLISTLKDNLGQGLAEAMAPAVVSIKAQLPAISAAIADGLKILGPILTDVVSQLIDIVGKLVPVVTPLLEEFGGVFADVLRGITPILTDLVPMFAYLARILAGSLGSAVTELLPEFRGLLKALGPLAVLANRLAITFIGVMAPALSALLRAATPLVEMFATGLSKAFDQLANLDVSSIFGSLSTIFVKVADALVPLVDVFLIFANEVGAAIVDMLPELVIGFADLALAFVPLLPDITRLARDLLPIAVELFRELAPTVIILARELIPLFHILLELRLIWQDMLVRVIMPFLPIILELATTVLPLLAQVLGPIVETMMRWLGIISDSTVGIGALGLALGLLGIGKLAWHFAQSFIQGLSLISVLSVINGLLVAQAAIQAEVLLASETGLVLTFWNKLAVGIKAASAQSLIFKGIMIALNIVMSPWFYIPVLIAAVAAAFYIAYREIQPFREAVDALWASFQRGIDWLKELIGILWSGDFTKAGEMISAMGTKIMDALSNIGTTIKDSVVEWANKLWEGLQAIPPMLANWFVNTLLPTVASWLAGLGNILLWLFTEAGPYLVKGALRLVLALEIWWYTTAIPWLVRLGWNALVAFIGWIKDAAPAALEALVGFLQALGPWFTGTAVPWLTEKAAALKDAFTAWVSEAVPALLAQLREWLTAAGDWITGTAIPWITEKVGGLAGAMVSWLIDVVPKLVIGLATFLFNLEKWYLTEAIPWLLRAGLWLLGAMLSFIQELPDRIIAGLVWAWNTIPGWIATAAVWLAEKAGAFGAALWGWIQEAVPALLEKLGGLLEPLGSWITDTAVPAVAEKAKGLFDAITGWIGEVVPKIPEKLGGILQAIGVWIAEEAIPTIISKGASLTLAMLGFLIQLPWKIPFYLAVVLYKIGEWIVKAVVWLVPKIWELGKAFLSWAWRLPIELINLLAHVLEAILTWIWNTAWTLAEKSGQLRDAFVSWIADVIKAAPGKLAEFAMAVWHWLEGAEKWLGEQVRRLADAFISWISSTIDAAPGKFEEFKDAILTFILSLPKKIEDASKGMFIGISNAFIAAINWIIRTWNKLELELPEIDTPWGTKVGGFKLESIDVSEIPSISEFAKGGRPPTNRPSIVGELGPELFMPDRPGTIIPNDALRAGGSGMTIGKVEVNGQDRPTDTAFAIRSELSWMSMLAGAT